MFDARDPGVGVLDGVYRFAHSVYHQVLYDGLAPPVGAHLHRRMGKLLFHEMAADAAKSLPHLSMHFERCGDWVRAVQFAIAAGDHAADVYANAEAMAHFTRDLQLTQRRPAADRIASSRVCTAASD